MLNIRWIFCSDTFDKNTPPVDDPGYISSLDAAIFRGMQSGDNNAVWLMQVNGYILNCQTIYYPSGIVYLMKFLHPKQSIIKQ